MQIVVLRELLIRKLPVDWGNLARQNGPEAKIGPIFLDATKHIKTYFSWQTVQCFLADVFVKPTPSFNKLDNASVIYKKPVGVMSRVISIGFFQVQIGTNKISIFLLTKSV